MIHRGGRGGEWGIILKDLANTHHADPFLRSLAHMEGETKASYNILKQRPTEIRRHPRWTENLGPIRPNAL